MFYVERAILRRATTGCQASKILKGKRVPLERCSLIHELKRGRQPQKSPTTAGESAAAAHYAWEALSTDVMARRWHLWRLVLGCLAFEHADIRILTGCPGGGAIAIVPPHSPVDTASKVCFVPGPPHASVAAAPLLGQQWPEATSARAAIWAKPHGTGGGAAIISASSSSSSFWR